MLEEEGQGVVRATEFDDSIMALRFQASFSALNQHPLRECSTVRAALTVSINNSCSRSSPARGHPKRMF
jgi:hypothetical protein